VIREIARHSDLQVTIGIYAHGSAPEKRKAFTGLSELIK
jgi:hypothetical protein